MYYTVQVLRALLLGLLATMAGGHWSLCYALDDVGCAVAIDTIGHGPGNFVNLDNYSPVIKTSAGLEISPAPGLQVLVRGDAQPGCSGGFINESALAAWVSGGMTNTSQQMSIFVGGRV